LKLLTGGRKEGFVQLVPGGISKRGEKEVWGRKTVFKEGKKVW